MAKIIVDEDCGNAPKKQFIKDFLIANANADIETATNMLADDINLIIPGHKSATGKEPVKQLLLNDVAEEKVSELLVKNILSHGDRCAANGILTFEDGSKVSFCNIYVFSNHRKDAKLKEITTYSIELKPE